MTMQLSSQIMSFFVRTRTQAGWGVGIKMERPRERPRFTMLHPEGSYNASKDIIERLLLDNMQDEVYLAKHPRSR